MAQSFNTPYVQHPGMQSQQHSPDNYPPPQPPPESQSQRHPHHHTPEHAVAYEDPQYAAAVRIQAPVYQPGQPSIGVSPPPGMVYQQYPPRPVQTPHAHAHAHAHAQASAPGGTGYGLGMSGYPGQPQGPPDVQSIPPQVQTFTPTAQGAWDQSGQNHHLVSYSSGFAHPMTAHSGYGQDLQAPQQPMEVSFSMPSQHSQWDPTNVDMDLNPSSSYPPASNAYPNSHAY
jgi:hypothetical protein